MSRTLAVETTGKTGETVTLKGWVDTKRDHGKLTFIDLRDRSGLVQVVGSQDLKTLHPEDVVEVVGTVQDRPEATVNEKLATGHIEVTASQVKLLNHSQPLPFPIDTDGRDIDQDIRYKYRYLDLRRPRLQQTLRFRSKYVQLMREYLFNYHFVEIETPILTKSTPEGSRDFVVPSRLYPGKFFALPQSPQQYKQLLMTAGFERYFQVARCLRDEDPRADRAYEHTQLDLEMSFTSQEEVMTLVEGMITYALTKLGIKLAQTPFPRIPYQQAMQQYGSDKFDLRTEDQKREGALAFAWVTEFPFFEKDKDGNWTFTHNPFSAPIPEHADWLKNKQNIGEITAAQYDLVCNGYEVGGGSIRSHNAEILQAVFEIMGHSQEKIQEQFGHMLEAFSLGTPPHGGCAHGFERMIMCVFNESAIGEVQAFPQTGRGRTSVMDAPSPLSHDQLAELGLQVTSRDQFASLHEYIFHTLNNRNIVFTTMTEDEARENSEHIVKNLVIDTGKEYIMYVLPLNERADLNRLAENLQVKRAALVSKDTLEQKLKLQIGAVPAFGSLIDLPVYLDRSISDYDTLVSNAALPGKAVKLQVKDYLELEKPVLVG